MSYYMQYRCWNCSSIFHKTLADGTIALGKGGSCPVCKIEDNKKIGYREFERTINHDAVGAIDTRSIDEL